MMNILPSKKNANFHIWTNVIYNVACAKNKGMACKVQDAFNNEYGSQEAFTRRAQKQPNHQDHQSLKEMFLSIVDLKVWKENLNETTLVGMKQKKQGRI